VKARVKGADLASVVQAEFIVNGKDFATDRRRPFLRKLPYGKLKRKRHSTVRLLVDLLDGRQITIDQHVRACR
jgi:hypothetical protein